MNYRHLVPGLACALCTLSAHAELQTAFGANVRYRYESFARDTASDENVSRASTVRLGMTLDAKVNPYLGAYFEAESVSAVFDNETNIAQIPGAAKAGYPQISDPTGTEMNQAYLRLALPDAKLGARLGYQEVFLNNGRFISNSAWRQNHQSLYGATVAWEATPALKIDYGHLLRVMRVTGEEATNGRANMSSNYVNAAYTWKDVGALKAYGVLLDFDKELANSADTWGMRFEGNMPLGSSMRLLSTLEYAVQSEAGDNPNTIDQDYIQIEAGLAAAGISYRAGYTVLGASSATDKFITPLAHPHNGWTENFLGNPSLGDSHGLQVISLSAAGPISMVSGLSFSTAWYSYSPDTGSAEYGSELDLGLEYKPSKPWTVGWRFARYFADELFADATRTSVYASFAF